MPDPTIPFERALKEVLRQHVAATMMRGAARRPLQLATAEIHGALLAQGSWQSPNGQWRVSMVGERLVTARWQDGRWETACESILPASPPA